MITSSLRRFGLWPVIAAVTLISIALSLAISGFVHVVVLGIEMPRSAWIITIGCPLLIAPTMSYHSFSLLLRLDQAHEQLRVISSTDHLTGASNRRHSWSACSAKRSAASSPRRKPGSTRGS